MTEKRVSLRVSRETERTEKDFPCELAGKKEWEKKQKKIFLASKQGKMSERKNRKERGDGASLIKGEQQPCGQGSL